MPEQPMLPMPVDSIENIPYKIGYSFRQPEVVKLVTQTSRRPYFAIDWDVSVMKKKQDLAKRPVLQRFPSIWRRAAKGKAIRTLGVVGNRKELPSFNELGEAPGPTDKETTSSSVTRSVFGFLDNMVKTTGGLITQSQQLEIQRAQAQQYPSMLPQAYLPSSGGIGLLGWTAILGVIGASVYFYKSRQA